MLTFLRGFHSDILREIMMRLRNDDELELVAAGVFDTELVALTLRATVRGGTFFVGDNAVAACGVSRDPDDPEAGLIWFLAKPDVEKHWRELVRATPYYLSWLAGPDFKRLAVWKLADTKQTRWLERSGFVPSEGMLLGDVEFIKYTREM